MKVMAGTDQSTCHVNMLRESTDSADPHTHPYLCQWLLASVTSEVNNENPNSTLRHTPIQAGLSVTIDCSRRRLPRFGEVLSVCERAASGDGWLEPVMCSLSLYASGISSSFIWPCRYDAVSGLGVVEHGEEVAFLSAGKARSEVKSNQGINWLFRGPLLGFWNNCSKMSDVHSLDNSFPAICRHIQECQRLFPRSGVHVAEIQR